MSRFRRALAALLAAVCLAVPVLAADGESGGEETACPHPGWSNGVCVACGAPCPHAEHDFDSCICFACGQRVGHSYVTSKCPMCGRVPAFTDTLVPKALFERSACPGTVETVVYRTHDYVGERKGAQRSEFSKAMNVYLPWGYDPAESYDVLVLLHGMGSGQDYWFGSQLYAGYSTTTYVSAVRLLDNMIEAGLCRKMIVVTPTFYRDPNSLRKYERVTDEEQFVRELREDILPCIIERYSTYAADTSSAAITAARDHFAYAGLSMGSIYAYNSVMPLCLDAFSWFGCFSGSDCYVDLAAAALNGATNAPYPIHYFYNSIGTNDSMAALHREQFIALTDRVNALTDGENAWFTQIRGAGHEYTAWIAGLYNFLQIVFAM